MVSDAVSVCLLADRCEPTALEKDFNEYLCVPLVAKDDSIVEILSRGLCIWNLQRNPISLDTAKHEPGTLLEGDSADSLCNIDFVTVEYASPIWHSANSWKQRGFAKAGDTFMVASKEKIVDGYRMLPLVGGGAVQSDHVRPETFDAYPWGPHLIWFELPKRVRKSKQTRDRVRSTTPRNKDTCDYHQRFEEVCLIDALRIAGVKVPYSQNGPFWALADGNSLLQPYGKQLRRIDELHPMHKYIMHLKDHFYAVKTFADSVILSEKRRSVEFEDITLFNEFYTSIGGVFFELNEAADEHTDSLSSTSYDGDYSVDDVLGGADQLGEGDAPRPKRFRPGTLLQEFRRVAAHAENAAPVAPAQAVQGSVTMLHRLDSLMCAVRRDVDLAAYSDDERKVFACANFLVAGAEMSGFKISKKDELFIFLIFNGEDYRAHMKHVYRYCCGCWDKTTDALEFKSRKLLLALEGIFIKLAEDHGDTEWTWASIEGHVKSLFADLHARIAAAAAPAAGVAAALPAGAPPPVAAAAPAPAAPAGDAIPPLAEYAKVQGDHVRKATNNKPWQANWMRRIADLTQRLKDAFDSPGTSGAITKLFLKECETPQPVSRGIQFADIYVNDDWIETAPSRDANCYFRLPYKFNVLQSDITMDGWSLSDYREMLDRVLRGMYYKNEHAWYVKLLAIMLAFKRVPCNKMIFVLGSGGDSKGTEARLEKGLMGSENSGKLDCGVFLDRSEFRKSGHFAFDKANVRIQECQADSRFLADIWKRFVVGEEIDLRVNYGFTIQVSFSESMKVWELNYENIPVIEEKKRSTGGDPWCEQLRRRVLCLKYGQAKFVAKDENEAEGKFLRIPPGELERFCNDPVTHSLLFKEYLFPFMKDHTIEEAAAALDDPASIAHELEADIAWLAQRLSGAPLSREDKENLDTSGPDKIVIDAHGGTPNKAVVRNYLISTVNNLPGLQTTSVSTRGKKSRIQVLDEALEISKCKLLLKDYAAGGYQKLVYNFSKAEDITRELGGEDVFGTWPMWGNTFQLRDQQKDYEELDEAALRLTNGWQLTGQIVRSSRNRTAVLRLLERVNLPMLEAYSRRKTDKSQLYLERTIERYRKEGRAVVNSAKPGLWETPITYLHLEGYGRAMGVGYCAQGLTNAARSYAFRSHAIDVDQEDSDHSLKYVEMLKLGIDPEAEFPMFMKRLRNRSAWVDFLARYDGISKKDAKRAFIAIANGGKLQSDVPFMRRLASDLTEINQRLVDANQWVLEYFGERSKPLISRACAVISFKEAELTASVAAALEREACSKEYCRIFDGAVVQCDTDSMRTRIDDVLQNISVQRRVPVRVKPWKADECYSLGVQLYEKGTTSELDAFVDVHPFKGACLYNALRSLEPGREDCRCSDDGPYCIADFNNSSFHNSQRDIEGILRLRHLQLEQIELLVNGVHKVICYQALAHFGHFVGLHFENGKVTVYDDLWGKALTTCDCELVLKLTSTDGFELFLLESVQTGVGELPEDGVYSLKGGGKTVVRKRPATVRTHPLKVMATIAKRGCASSGKLLHLHAKTSFPHPRFKEGKGPKYLKGFTPCRLPPCLDAT